MPRANCCSTRRATRSAVSAAGSRRRQRHDLAVGDQRRCLGEMRRQRLAGCEIHLERAHQPFAISRHDSRGRLGIDPLQHAMQAFGALSIGHPVEARSQALVSARTRETARGSARGSRNRCLRRESAVSRGRGCRESRVRRPRRIAPRCRPRSDRRCRSGDAGCLAAPRSTACRCRYRSPDRPPSSRS